MSEVFLNGGLERLLREAVKVKSGLPWRPQDVDNARAMQHLVRKVANREWNQPKRKTCTVGNKAERSWTLTSDMEMQSLEFVPCFSALLWSVLEQLNFSPLEIGELVFLRICLSCQFCIRNFSYFKI